MAVDTHYSAVSLLLQFGGAHDSVNFFDNGPAQNPVVPVGGAKISTAQSKWGGSSGYFDGIDDYLIVPTGISAGLAAAPAWCIEAFVRIASPPVVPSGNSKYYGSAIFGQTYNGGNGEQGVWVGEDGKLVLSLGRGVGGYVIASTDVITAGVWTHVAVSYDGSVARLFVDGVVQAATISGRGWGNTGAECRVGYIHIPAYPQYRRLFNGYIGALRITAGAARYTAGFVPAADSFPAGAVQVSGTVKDATNALVPRFIRAIREDTGVIVGSTTSDATTGEYAIACGTSGPHTLVAYPAAGEDLPALTLRGVMPV